MAVSRGETERRGYQPPPLRMSSAKGTRAQQATRPATLHGVDRAQPVIEQATPSEVWRRSRRWTVAVDVM
jgi:hypothetical protein